MNDLQREMVDHCYLWDVVKNVCALVDRSENIFVVESSNGGGSIQVSASLLWLSLDYLS